ncbi:MAG: formylmethanofuran--tetrahydromethanopterin N-formyltransferase [Planctomycetales bacterium]
MELHGTQILDTFAEAFDMRYVRLIITAHDEYWLQAAIREFTGYSSSVIACDAETGVEKYLNAHETPDGRCGVSVLVFGFSKKALAKAVPNRTGQCLMTCPTTAVFDGLETEEDKIPLGKHIRYFGDGFQKSKKLFDRRYWRIPVMDGEFLVEERLGVGRGVAGGNIILQATDLESALSAARRGTDAVAEIAGVIAPFPGGVARSGSKVGSIYKQLPASTADAYCPTVRSRTDTALLPEANYALEIVIDGTGPDPIAAAMAAALHAASGENVVAIGAGNYGGKLGKHQFALQKLLDATPPQ